MVKIITTDRPSDLHGQGLTALYIRVATSVQTEIEHSFNVQKEKLIEFCDQNGYSTYEIYKDCGQSGNNIERPGIERMISDILNGKVTRVVVYKLDRLSRSYTDMVHLLDNIFAKNNVELISVSENHNILTFRDKVSFGIR